MVFRYISSKLKQINSHILFGPPWLMHLLLSGQEFNPQKTNKQSSENKEIIHFFYQIALFILFSIWKWSAHFVFEAFRIQVAVQSKLKTNKNKKQQKTPGEHAISYSTIVLSSYDADLSFDQNTDQRLFFLQVTVADNTNSRNNNTICEITHDKMIISFSECVIFFTVFITECVVIVTVNLLSIILFIKNKSLRTRSMYLVMSLTVADLLVGSLSGSVDSFYSQNRYCPFVKKYSLSREVRIAFLILIPLFPFVSLTNIAVISLERFHATFRPFRHRLIKRWVYVVAIAVVWVLSIITLVIVGIEYFLMTSHPLYLSASYCCLCLIVTFVSYTSILFKFRFGAHPQRHCAAALRQRKLTVTLFITTLVSLLLWLPYSILYLLVDRSSYISLNSLSGPERIRLLSSLNFLRYANSVVNPILYAVRMPDFKKALLSLFRRPQRENVAIPLIRY